MIFVNLKTKNINAIQYNQVPETNGHECISNYCCYPSLVGEDRKICYEWCVFLKKIIYSSVIQYILVTVSPPSNPPSPHAGVHCSSVSLQE